MAAGALAAEVAVEFADAEAVDPAPTEATARGVAGAIVLQPAVKTPAIAVTQACVRVPITRRTDGTRRLQVAWRARTRPPDSSNFSID